MKSAFFEFNVAISALYTARGNLDVTSHNISNASVKGYSRQYAEQRASLPMSNYGRGMVGTGSEIYGVGQRREYYLDKKYWTERGVLGEYTAKRTQLDIMENLLNEMPGVGLSKAFDDFFKKLQDLTQASEDMTYRSNVVQSAKSLASLVQSKVTSLQKQQAEINEEISTIVSNIDSIGKRISVLNQQIYRFEINGEQANDLRDERARLVDELSKYVNVDAYEVENNKDYATGKYPEPEDRGKSNKHFIVLINGQELVNHFDAHSLQVVKRGDPAINPFDMPGLFDVQFGNGNTFDLRSPSLKGELKGLVDVRDGNAILGGETPTTNYKGIPYYIERLNSLVRTFALAVNEGLDRSGNPIQSSSGGTIVGHTSGYDLDGETGNLFFSFNSAFSNVKDDLTNYPDPTKYANGKGDAAYKRDILAYYKKFNVFNFNVASELSIDSRKIAASSNNSGQSNNQVILGFANIKTSNRLFAEGKIDDFIIGVAGELAIDSQQSQRFAENYVDVTTMIDNQRMSVSGVDLNEELVNMTMYMQLYQAASKLINAIDSIYDTTINRLGAF